MSFKESGPGLIYLDHCRHLLEVYRPSTVLYEISGARKVSNNAKHALLSFSRDTSESGKETLQKLFRIDPWAASQFGLKTLAVEDFVMRLVYESSTHDALSQEGPSFIILSYTWHNSEWAPHPSLGCTSKDTQTDALPLTPAMWSAFLSQRISSSEGFWCDQLCIVQKSENDLEKVNAIGAMDLLYKSARKVVVALEDIAITKEELDALVELSKLSDALAVKDPNSHSEDRSQQRADRTASAFGKIVQARWFGRAWCFHEFLVSRNHTFLIPVSDEEGDGVVTIVRLDSLFLFRVSLSFQKRSFLASKDNFVTRQNFYRFDRFIGRLRSLAMAKAFGSKQVDTDGSYMHMASEIFSLSAFMMSDKISILLNVMNSGLYYKSSKPVTEEDCYRLATVVALASGDSTALTTNGSPFHSLHRKPETQWLRKPVSAVFVQPVGPRSFPKVGTDLTMTEQGLQLDMQFLCSSANVASAEDKNLSIATWLIDSRVMFISPAPREPALDLWLDLMDSKGDRYTAIRLYSIQALACALQLGADWIFQVDVKLSTNGPPPINFRANEGSKQVFKDAVNFALSLKSDDHLGPDNCEIRGENEQLPSEANRWYWNLLKFTQRLVVIGLAVEDGNNTRVAAYTDTEFAVQILHLPDADVPPFVVFAPVWDYSPDSSSNFCMPEMLANEAFRSVSRLWILKKSKEDGTGKSFELVSKTRLIGSVDVPDGERMGKVVIVG